MTYKIMAAVLLLVGWSVACFHEGEVARTAKDEKATIATENKQLHQETAQINTNVKAESTHDAELQEINTPVVRDRLILRNGALTACPSLPISAPAGDPHPPGRAADAGSGGAMDIRPAVDRFEQIYETALSDCRRLEAEWPK